MTSVDTAPSASADENGRLDDLRVERDRLRAECEALRAERDGLREAMRNRAVIEQAKGVLAVRHGIDPDAAFERLRTESQRRNVRLAELAAAVVAGAGRPEVGSS